ncbi:MAG: 30S ribosomal protein S16 [Candidatus Colwellbacteria bacterium]|nr:30S ribosomal protein S16 [Candidatus Colwellbacteria bacterium]
MLSIKLKMVGRKGQRTFRVIVQEAKAKVRGKFVEDLGWYNPHSNAFEVKKERVLYWLGVGAKPSETVRQILKKLQVDWKGRK